MLPGVRAALCLDSESAKGARKWNHANVLVLSILSTTIPMAEAILDVWFTTPLDNDDWNLEQIAYLDDMESVFGRD
ncbi:RpiB/LacA/LacB family sugar-phosphate isomerase [Shewanella surugensis]|uniref:RpiB/LacA/LacB family sugar-phosphate isomerase n=1 Tax=Shewanella surugensis TaxID=212020 RepID=A0ABT0LFC8_9GAMM|nr:RpiB/LacA/LacB family sugar-phosphate isomerase [Shewanella surugensis]MCL1126412.1 RpiB/LacA/LacB family sugar-phosphate isomerase [Shewanella surugensis]